MTRSQELTIVAKTISRVFMILTKIGWYSTREIRTLVSKRIIEKYYGELIPTSINQKREIEL